MVLTNRPTPELRTGRCRPRWRWPVAIVMLAASFALAPTSVTSASVASATATAGTFAVMDQSISVAVGEPVRVVIRLAGTIPADAEVVVTAHRVITERRGFRAAMDGVLGPVSDRITLPLAELGRTPEGYLDVLVPTTSGASGEDALALVESGIHPLSLRVTGAEGDALGEVTTMVHVESGDHDMDTLEVAYVARLTARPTLRPDGGTTLEPDAREQLERLITLLEGTTATFSVSLAPELLDGLALAESGAEILNRLDVALAGRELLVEPYVTMDPSGAARSALIDIYTRQLRAGEDVMAEHLPRHLSRRSAHLVDGAIDAGGATLLRDLGMRSLVLTPSAQADLGLGGATIDPTLLLNVEIGVDATMPAAVVDPLLADAVVGPDDDLFTTARLVVLEFLVIRAEVLESNSSMSRHTLTVSTPDGTVGDPDLVARVLNLVSATPGLRATTASVTGTVTDNAMADGREVTVSLPTTAGPELRPLAERLFALTIDTATIGSMLPEEDPRPNRWERLMLVMPAVELSTAELDGFEAAIRRDLDLLRSAIGTPPVSDVTLGGRLSTIRLKVRNDSDVPLTVSVRLESSKLSFPRGEEVVTLAPRDVTEVEIPVEARTNGRFPVSVTLLTPSGDVPLHPPVEFAARVNAITGMGQAVTAAAVLILITWWVHHLRVRRRDRRAAASLELL